MRGDRSSIGDVDEQAALVPESDDSAGPAAAAARPRAGAAVPTRTGWALVRYECVDVLSYTAVAGALHIQTVAKPFILEQFSISIGTLSMIDAIATAVVGPLVTAAMGPLMRRYNPARIIACAMIFAPPLALLLSAVQTLPQYSAAYILVTMCKVSGDVPCRILLAATHFSDAQLPSIAAIIGSAYSLSGATIPVFAASFMTAFGWRMAFVVWAFVAAAWIPCSLHTLRAGPISVGDGRASKRFAEAADGFEYESIVRSSKFGAFLCATMLIMAVEGFIVGHLQLFLQREAGKTVVEAAYFYTAFFWCGFAGKVSMGFMLSSGRLSRKVLLGCSSVGFASCWLLLLNVSRTDADGIAATAHVTVTTNSVRLYSFCISYGYSFGCLYSNLLVHPALLFGRRALPRIQAFLFAAVTLGQQAGDTLCGVLHDVAGSYLPLAVMCCGFSLLNLPVCYAIARWPTYAQLQQQQRGGASKDFC